MADLYKIQLTDEVSAPANRARAAARRLGGQITSIGAAGKRSARGVSSLGTAASRMGGAFARAGRSIRGAVTSLGRANGSMRQFVATSASSSLTGALGPFGGLVSGAGKSLGPIAAVAAGLAGAAAATVKLGSTANTLSNYQSALTSITGSAAGADKAIEAVRQQSQAIGLDFAATLGNVTASMRRGFGLQDALQLSGLRADLEALNPDAPNRVATAFEQLEKGLQRGKFEAEAFDSLRAAGVDVTGVLDRLGAQTGKSAAQVQKGLASGAVSATQFASALRDVQLERFGTDAFGTLAAEESLKTLSGQFGNFKAALESGIIVPLARQLLPVLKSSVDGLASFGGWLAKNGDMVMSTLKGIGIVVAGLAVAWGAFNVSLLASVAVAAAVPLAIAAGVAAVGFAVGQLIEHWDEVKAFFVSSWNDATAWVAGIGRSITSFFEDFSLVGMGRDIILGLAQGITGAAGAAVGAITGVAGDLLSSAADVLGIASPSKAFAEHGRDIDEGLAMGIADDSDMVFQAAGDLADGAVSEAQAASMSSGTRSQALASTAQAAGGSFNTTNTATQRGPVQIGPFNVSGAESPEETASVIRDTLADELASLFDQHAEGAGA